MEVILVTERCYLREMTLSDRPALERMLKDRTVMAAYEHAFADREVDEWLERQMDRYQRDGFGLWAVVNAKTGDMIGQCGITLQKIPRHCGISIQQQERADRFCRRRGIGNFNSDDSSNEYPCLKLGIYFGRTHGTWGTRPNRQRLVSNLPFRRFLPRRSIPSSAIQTLPRNV